MRRLRQDRIPVEEESHHQRGVREPAMRGIDLSDLVETIRAALLVREPDLTTRFANRSFGETFTVAPKDTPRDREGRQ
jgi:hypothetical protein